jgi:heme/copper-type cytochrome/quinol oxidase subunit 3
MAEPPDVAPGDSSPLDEKKPGHGAPDLGNEPDQPSTAVTEAIDEIPMGGVPEPGATGDEQRADSNVLTEIPIGDETVDEFSDITESGHHEGPHGTTGLSNNKMAMWLFLGSECLLFGGLISTYMLYRGRHYGSLGPDQIYDIPFTSVSSFVLLMSSLTMVLAVSSAARHDIRNTKLWLTVTALLGATFVGGQVYEFTTFYREGLGFTSSLFSSSFYTLTGFHGVHVTVGIIMLLALVGIISRNRVTGQQSEVVELVGLYWHFVDIVWIVIFTLVYLIPA